MDYTLIVLLIILAIAAIGMLVFGIPLLRDYLKGRKRKEENFAYLSELEIKKCYQKGKLAYQGITKEEISQEIIQKKLEEKKEEEKQQKQAKERLKEILGRDLVLSRVIKKTWENKIGDELWPFIVLLGRNKKEEIKIDIHSLDRISISPKNLPWLKQSFYYHLEALSDQEIDQIENWIIDNYTDLDAGF